MMRGILAVALLLAGLPGQSGAWLAQAPTSATPTEQVMTGGTTGVTSSTADRYAPFGHIGGFTAAPATKSFTAPVAGAITGWKFFTRTAPTATATYDATLVINGTPSAATCQVTSSSSPAGVCDWTGSVAIAAGDGIDVLVHPTNSPATTTVAYSAVFQPTTPNDTIVTSAARNVAFSASAAQATYPGSGGSPAAIASRRLGVVPDAGTISAFYVRSVAPGAAASGKQYDYKLQQNGGDPASIPGCTIFEDATTCNDTAHSFTVAAGDDLAFLATPTATPTASEAAMGAKYIPSTAGHYAHWVTSSTPDAGSGIYYGISGGQIAGGATETDWSLPTHAQTFKHIECKLSAAPGAGKSRTFTLRVNAADSGLAVTIADTATAGSATATVAVSANDLIALASTGASTPTSANIGCSLLATR